jgi:hypothetical protein
VHARHSPLRCCLQAHRSMPRHRVRTLGARKARELFRCHTEVRPSGDLLAVEKQILARCKGLPLALKLAGSRLRQTDDLPDWQVSLMPLEAPCCGRVIHVTCSI